VLADVQMKWMREQSYYDGGEPAGWRSRRATEGGSLANQGIHMVDELYWLLGPVQAVEYGRLGTVAHQIETEDLCLASLTFRSGAWGLLETTTSAFPDRGTKIEINGTAGSVYLRGDAEAEIRRADGEVVDLDAVPVAARWPRHCFEDMVWAVREGWTPACPGIEGLRSVEILSGVYQAHATGQRVELNQPPATR